MNEEERIIVREDYGGKINGDIGFSRRQLFKIKCAKEDVSMITKIKELIDEFLKVWIMLKFEHDS